MTDYPGIDYGMGLSNIDRDTGCRYGIIPVSLLGDFAWDNFESDYGEPTCPRCGNTAAEYDSNVAEAGEGDSPFDHYHRYSPADFMCTDCRLVLASDDVLGDEPLGHFYHDDEYDLRIDSQNDVWVFRSPYFTHAQLCSPCAPGAGYLASPCPDGPRTYCLDVTWFWGEKAPYPVYRVDNGEEVRW